MRLHEHFEWDPKKDRANRRNHEGISFDQAAETMMDPMGDRFQVDEHQFANGEDCWLTYTSHPNNRNLLLAIVWTERVREDKSYTRIISARRAGPMERETYEQQIFK